MRELSVLFNEALRRSFDLRRLFILFVAFCVWGLLFLFFGGLAKSVESWLGNALVFVPFFLGVGVVLAAGTLICKLYALDKSDDDPSVFRVMKASWDALFKAAYFSLPLLVLYLCFWVFIALFLLLKSIPYIGVFLGVVFASLPFLINCLTLLLMVSSVLLLYYGAPLVASGKAFDRKRFFSQIQGDFFFQLVHLGIALFPFWLVSRWMGAAWKMTRAQLFLESSLLGELFGAFFMMIPAGILLSFTLHFFFNFAFEAHVLREEKKA